MVRAAALHIDLSQVDGSTGWGGVVFVVVRVRGVGREGFGKSFKIQQVNVEMGEGGLCWEFFFFYV